MPKTPPPPLALPPCLPSELLTYILTHQSFPTYLLICSTRAGFLSQLLDVVVLPVSNPEPEAPIVGPPSWPSSPLPTEASHPDQEDTTGIDPEQPQEMDGAPGETLDQGGEVPLPNPTDRKHHLLVPTLAQLLSSRHVHLFFLPTLSHLRAHLTVFPSSIPSSSVSPYLERSGTRRLPLLCVYGLVNVHKETSEWSAQGLSSTVAGLVEAGLRAGVRVVIVEPKDETEPEPKPELAAEPLRNEGQENNVVVTQGDEEMVEIEDPVEGLEVEGREDSDREKERARARKAAEQVWMQRIPLLSGNIRRGGVEGSGIGGRVATGLAWSGRTIEVGSVMKRWCKFGDVEWL